MTDHARKTIQASVNGVQAECVFDTGSSPMLLLQDAASMAAVTALRAVDEISPR